MLGILNRVTQQSLGIFLEQARELPLSDPTHLPHILSLLLEKVRIINCKNMVIGFKIMILSYSQYSSNMNVGIYNNWIGVAIKPKISEMPSEEC